MNVVCCKRRGIKSACQILVGGRKVKKQIERHNTRNGCDTRNRSIMAILYVLF